MLTIRNLFGQILTFINKVMLLHCSEIALVMNMAQHYIQLLETSTGSIVSETPNTNHSLHTVCLPSCPWEGVTGTSYKPESRFENSFFRLSCLSAELCHWTLLPVLQIYTPKHRLYIKDWCSLLVLKVKPMLVTTKIEWRLTPIHRHSLLNHEILFTFSTTNYWNCFNNFETKPFKMRACLLDWHAWCAILLIYGWAA